MVCWRWIKLRSHGPLDLHRSAGRHHGRGNHGRHVGGSRSENRGPGACGSAGSQHAAASPAGSSPPAGTVSESDQPGQYPERTKRGSEDCQLAADAAKLRAVIPASGAVAEVAA